jgi:hypothetical protein
MDTRGCKGLMAKKGLCLDGNNFMGVQNNCGAQMDIA